jgi:hypothetical protein
MKRPPLTIEPFATAALDLTDRGLIVVPNGRVDGKSPLVGHWEKRKARKTIITWQEKFATANIGVAVGASGFVVVDIDQAEGDPVELGFKWFGPTPLVMQTPRDGVHLWYQKAGQVRSRLLDEIPGLKGDIKADGGQVVVPPSYNRQTGSAYSFLKGTWDDLKDLPEFRDPRLVGAGPDQAREPKKKANRGEQTSLERQSGKILEGSRNDTLFRLGLAIADEAHTIDELDAGLRHLNESLMSPPLPEAEVLRTQNKLWTYKEQGTLWLPGQGGGVTLSAAELSLLKLPHGDEALVLLIVLKRSHALREGTFAISDQSMADHKIIAGWGPKIYARARTLLLKEGWIVKKSRAFRDADGQWKAAQYQFSTPSAKTADNITYTPPAPPPALIRSVDQETAPARFPRTAAGEGEDIRPQADGTNDAWADVRSGTLSPALRCLGRDPRAEAAGWMHLRTKFGQGRLVAKAPNGA